MKINQVLVESTGATVAFAFGRFNPAHQGHIEVWRTVEQAGKNWFIGTNPNTIGPNDPLTFQQKSAWMEEIYPPISGHIIPQTNVLTLAAYIFKKLRNNESASIAYVTDDTDWAWSGKLLNQYNGVEGSHGYYKFAEITHVPSPRVSSATDLRNAARADDKVAFYHASGTDPKLKVAGLTYFDTVKQAAEKYPLPVKRAKKVTEMDSQGYTGSRDHKSMSKYGSRDDYELGKGKGKEHTGKAITANNMVKAAKKAWDYATEPVDAPNMDTYKKHRAKNIADIRKKKQQGLAEVSTELRNRYVTRASDDYGSANFAARASKSHPGLEDYSKEQEQRAKKRAAGLNRALSDKRLQRESEEQKTVAKTWDQMTPQEKSSGVKGRTVWNEKTKKYYTVFDVPVKQTTDEASLATMRDYFAGDENARDPYEITKQRLHFAKDKDAKPTTKKEFRSQWEYEQWLKQNKLKQISGVREDEEAGEVEQQGQLIPFPQGTTKVAVSDVYDWYKLGQVISDLDDADPADFGQGAPETVIAFGSEEEEHKLLPLLQRLGLKLKDIDQPVREAYHAGSLYEMLKKERTKGWALINKSRK